MRAYDAAGAVDCWAVTYPDVVFTLCVCSLVAVTLGERQHSSHTHTHSQGAGNTNINNISINKISLKQVACNAFVSVYSLLNH